MGNVSKQCTLSQVHGISHELKHKIKKSVKCYCDFSQYPVGYGAPSEFILNSWTNN